VDEVEDHAVPPLTFPLDAPPFTLASPTHPHFLTSSSSVPALADPISQWAPLVGGGGQCVRAGSGQCVRCPKGRCPKGR
jgi:hypothetical protein